MHTRHGVACGPAARGTALGVRQGGPKAPRCWGCAAAESVRLHEPHIAVSSPSNLTALMPRPRPHPAPPQKAQITSGSGEGGQEGAAGVKSSEYPPDVRP